jgi:suppressor of G2 allele of SKP1
MSVDLAQRV